MAKTKENNLLFSIYGARYSKKGDRVNISLVSGEKDQPKNWGTISISKTNEEKIKITDNYVYIKVPFLKDLPKKEHKKEEKDVSKDELPF